MYSKNKRGDFGMAELLAYILIMLAAMLVFLLLPNSTETAAENIVLPQIDHYNRIHAWLAKPIPGQINGEPWIETRADLLAYYAIRGEKDEIEKMLEEQLDEHIFVSSKEYIEVDYKGQTLVELGRREGVRECKANEELYPKTFFVYLPTPLDDDLISIRLDLHCKNTIFLKA